MTKFLNTEAGAFIVMTSVFWVPFFAFITAIFIDGIFGTRIIDTFLQLTTHR